LTSFEDINIGLPKVAQVNPTSPGLFSPEARNISCVEEFGQDRIITSDPPTFLKLELLEGMIRQTIMMAKINIVSHSPYETWSTSGILLNNP
jgi:hypothetical protein